MSPSCQVRPVSCLPRRAPSIVPRKPVGVPRVPDAAEPQWEEGSRQPQLREASDGAAALRALHTHHAASPPPGTSTTDAALDSTRALLSPPSLSRPRGVLSSTGRAFPLPPHTQHQADTPGTLGRWQRVGALG
ncbi:prolactin-releasing peptide isoform X1 [Erinaceus europaeus]|uniref:Prolactin-releasing peptide isoform X1 n=1 Tax=Erinaceus europaeus TaxID=9365 RepID=A0ABM3WVT1_ERIEU|nr:prolactin-releasing peptide isoform X1 [Erinaceus europaeus]